MAKSFDIGFAVSALGIALSKECVNFCGMGSSPCATRCFGTVAFLLFVKHLLKKFRICPLS